MPITSISQLDPNGTYTDYLTWQITELVELLRGKVMRRMSVPTDQHQEVVGKLHILIGQHLWRQSCQVRVAPYDVRLPQRGPTADQAVYTVVQPDSCVIYDPSKIERRGCLGAPDLIVEVLSPGTAARDWQDKFDLYQESGVGEYWIVGPLQQDSTVFVVDEATARYRRVGEYASAGPVPCATLPGLALDWSDIFTELVG